MTTPILDRVNGPADLRTLTIDEMHALATEIRGLLLAKVSVTGGHVGPNLGVVELTIALHDVFNSPVDHIVWDVSHQSYTHKILTGRKGAWMSPDHYHDVGPYTDPTESAHDYYNIGHTSTSVGLADGMAVARDQLGATNNVIAVIGDGSLSGGMAFEALSNVAEHDTNTIVIVNDNEMSIAEDHGGLYRGLADLRATNGQSEHNLFKALGLDYVYLEEGNDVEKLIATLQSVKDTKHPVVVHIHTQKGEGYAPAMDNEEAFHWHMPFDLATGKSLVSDKETYNDVVLDVLDQEIAAGLPIVAINAAIPGVFGLKRFAAKYPKRYFDVGIAEQQSITFAAGLANQGVRPVAFENATFLQRAYDQMSHDLGVNKLPALIMVKGGTVTGGDPTHQATFDMPMLANIPGMRFLTPTTKEELRAMMAWALRQTDGPVAIRIPSNGVHSAPLAADFDALKMNTVVAGSRVAIMGVGTMLPLANEIREQLAAKDGIQATVIDPRLASDLEDTATLDGLLADHNLVVTLEENSVAGGFGEKVSHYYGPTAMKTLVLGAKKRFDSEQTRAELMNEYHLTAPLAVADIEKVLGA